MKLFRCGAVAVVALLVGLSALYVLADHGGFLPSTSASARYQDEAAK